MRSHVGAHHDGSRLGQYFAEQGDRRDYGGFDANEHDKYPCHRQRQAERELGDDQKADRREQDAVHGCPLGAEAVGQGDDDELADNFGNRDDNGNGAESGQNQTEAGFHPEAVVDVKDLVRGGKAEGEYQGEDGGWMGADHAHGRQRADKAHLLATVIGSSVRMHQDDTGQSAQRHQ